MCDIKFLLGVEIVERFYDATAAKRAQEDFIGRFQKGAMPDDMPEVEITAMEGSLPIANILKDAGLTKSTSDAMRMIKQGAVKRDGEKISDAKLVVSKGESGVYQVGKRKFAKITVV